MNTFSLVTNACAADDVRIRHSIPSWLRVFGGRLAELVVVVDEQPPTGRIAALHGQPPELKRLYRELETLAKSDPRIRVCVLDAKTQAERTLQKWFGKDRPIRCQAGTPIFAFVQSIEEAKGPIVFRCDCDMFFHDGGWVQRAINLVESASVELVEPSRVGIDSSRKDLVIATRAFMLDQRRLRSWLPIKAHKLDLLRQIHRRLAGHATWLPLEHMLEIERKQGKLRQVILGSEYGGSLHVGRRSEATLPWFEQVVALVERGEIPATQVAKGEDFVEAAWAPLFAKTPDYTATGSAVSAN